MKTTLIVSAMAVAFAELPAKTSAPTIPLCPGLTIVTAVIQQSGDYESIKTIESVGPKEVRLKYSAESPGGLFDAGPVVKTVVHRTMLASDLESARTYQQIFIDKSDETVPGTTSVGISGDVLRALKTKGEVDIQISNAYGGLQLSADRNKFPSYYSYMQAAKLKRGGTASVPVLVNDRLVQLPAIRAEGESVGDKLEFLFLDDDRNPLTLAFRIGIDGIKPLIPEQIQFCETLRKANAPVQSMAGLRCDLPKGRDRDTLRVIRIT
jgi:hypothetical protein